MSIACGNDFEVENFIIHAMWLKRYDQQELSQLKPQPEVLSQVLSLKVFPKLLLHSKSYNVLLHMKLLITSLLSVYSI
jgi:hypothetical protein